MRCVLPMVGVAGALRASIAIRHNNNPLDGSTVNQSPKLRSLMERQSEPSPDLTAKRLNSHNKNAFHKKMCSVISPIKYRTASVPAPSIWGLNKNDDRRRNGSLCDSHESPPLSKFVMGNNYANKMNSWGQTLCYQIFRWVANSRVHFTLLSGGWFYILHAKTKTRLSTSKVKRKKSSSTAIKIASFKDPL